MSSTFTFTFDTRHGLSLVSGEAVVLDLTGVRIERRPDGAFACEVTRGEECPVRLVASATPEGKLALERANGRESPVPGFVTVVEPPKATTVSALRDEIAQAFGWSPGTLT